jgi:integrase
MPTMNFTDRAVAGLSPVRRVYFDRQIRGLALRVGARDRVWYFTYRNGGPTQWYRLGTYPAVKLAAARKEAGAVRHRLEVDGIDPAAERRKPAPAPTPPAFTFKDFAPSFVAFQKGRVKDWANDEAKIDRYILPAWGPLPLKEITRRHVHELLDSVAGKGLTIGVNRLQALISRIFTVALDRSLIDAHPAARVIKRFKETPRDRVLTDDELRALCAGLDAQPGAASDAMRLRLLLGQRGAETAGLCWSELDLDAGLWTLPRRRTKTTQRDHVVPLPPTALELLTRRRAAVPADEARVFAGLTLSGDEHRAIGTIHGGAYEWKDLRRTVATRLADLGIEETVIGRLLNHAKHSITGKHYNQHAYLDEIRHALTVWDTELARIVSGAPRRKPRVLRMPSRAGR